MITPRKNSRFEWLLKKFVHFQLKKHFYRIWLIDLRKKPSSLKGKMYLANHSSWWDGLIVFYLNQVVIKEDSYAMMSQEGMERFPFFRKIGAFSVNSKSPKAIHKSLKFAMALLEAGRSVWIFPQGEEEHLEKRPLSIKNGTPYIVKRVKNIDIIPVALYYTYRHDQRPELFIRIGSERSGERQMEREDIQKELTKELDVLKADVIDEKLVHFSCLLTGRTTISEKMEWLKGRSL
ncbi:lysophospholipid acyltransferase family protein [Falsibacillus albus]|uniref:Glycerol acyltransferase n=1 Tax=Falsibacillus albus TaxID=2478915 RepID=A0A3L7JYN6_9BACI|nr:lysophospholipid acyltransferase family protein [Falsibacillus albus]RLQ95219.1 glycerol acyltransferase [Falsibacillus albus]